MVKNKLFILALLIVLAAQAEKKRILIFGSAAEEKKELAKHSDRYKIIYFSDYYRQDPIAIIKKVKKKYGHNGHKKIDGTLCTQDYQGNICATLAAHALKLPGPNPKSILTCHNKYYSRKAQNRFVPEATATFGLIDPKNLEDSLEHLPLSFPFFAKPIKAYFSWGSEIIKDKQTLTEKIDKMLPSKQFFKPLNRATKKYTDFKKITDHILAEELLSGQQLTIEGYFHKGNMHTIGITDAHMYPGTISFEHFEYPSSLQKQVQERIQNIAERCMKGLGFDNGFFNIEMMYNQEQDSIKIIEINPRCSVQFADLYKRVDGINELMNSSIRCCNFPTETANPVGSWPSIRSESLNRRR